ncbi:MAG TPA: paraquat-inducible protein A [Thermoanaerobaculia bacterium]|jgi:paraquat-inducible protein A|nr:paraquat-inducible protein A [Thermoanaerobaculia bacterium]
MTITCADCGSTQVVPELTERGVVECHRCDRVLARRTGAGIDGSLALSATILLLLPPAVVLPLMASTIKQLVFGESRLVTSVPVIYSEVWFPLAFGFLFFAFLFPEVRALLQVIVLGAVRFGWHIPNRGQLFRWSEELRIWSLTDVVVIAGVVAYFRASISATVQIGIGAWTYLLVAIFSITADRLLDRRAVWHAIMPDRHAPRGTEIVSCDVCEMTMTNRRSGDACPRCGETLDHRIAPRWIPAVAAIGAAVPLCFPAYAGSIMINQQLTAFLEHTVFGTVQMLADRGYWQFGVVVLVAGVAIPVVELIGMMWLLGHVRFPNTKGLVRRTRLYRVLHRLVRWPMIIPFIAALAAPIVDFKGIDAIETGPGATPLFAVIALIMLAVRLFEPRMMWKTAGEVAS